MAYFNFQLTMTVSHDNGDRIDTGCVKAYNISD